MIFINEFLDAALILICGLIAITPIVAGYIGP